MLNVLKDFGFIPHKKNTRGQRAKIYDNGEFKLLYYDNGARGEFFTNQDDGSNSAKGDVIALIKYLTKDQSNDSLLNYLNTSHQIDRSLRQETINESAEEQSINDIFELHPFKQLGYPNYLTAERKIDRSTLESYTKTNVCMTTKKFNGHNNIIFPFYHLDKAHAEYVLKAQLLKNVTFKGFCQNSKKANSLWYAYLHTMARDLYVFEDPIDAISFEELFLSTVTNTAYNLIAFGGQPASGQFVEIIKYTSLCPSRINLYLCMDNDLKGAVHCFSLLSFLSSYQKGFDMKFHYQRKEKYSILRIYSNQPNDELTYFLEKYQFEKGDGNEYSLKFVNRLEQFKFILHDIAIHFFDYIFFNWAVTEDHNHDLRESKEIEQP